MPWHDESPWRRKHRLAIQTPEQRLAEIERKCMAGDIGLRQALAAAYALGSEQQARLIPGASKEG